MCLELRFGSLARRLFELLDILYDVCYVGMYVCIYECMSTSGVTLIKINIDTHTHMYIYMYVHNLLVLSAQSRYL